MKAKDLIGKKVTRIAPAECHYGKDHSYMGSVIIILNADDEFITFTDEGGILNGTTHTLDIEWCDNNWKDVDELLDVSHANMEKMKTLIQNSKHTDSTKAEHVLEETNESI